MKTMNVIVLSAIVVMCAGWVTFADDEIYSEHEYSGYMSSFPISGLFVFILAVIAGVFVVTLIAKKNGNTNSKPKNIKKQEAAGILEGKIMAMLNESDTLKQHEIQKKLGVPSDLISSTLFALEKSGHITRDWKVENYRDTYRVKVT